MSKIIGVQDLESAVVGASAVDDGVISLQSQTDRPSHVNTDHIAVMSL